MIGQRTNAPSNNLRTPGSRGRPYVARSVIPATVLLLATFLVACGGGTGTPTSVTGVSVTLASVEIAVGEQTSASATVQGTGGPSQSVTWSTSDSAIATVDAGGLVSGAGTGTADIVATSQADGTVSGTAAITVVPALAVNCSAPQALTGAITTDTTVDRDCYDVTGVVTVSGGATLTIEPGTIMRFANTSGVKVEIDGALIAAGTASEPIVLRGMVATPAAWLGLHVRSGDPRNVLDHVTVEYAGRHNTSFHNSAQTQFRSGVRLA
ncbi:MAG: Ig domain-containing protein, partial [Trueperaceae bacterium]